MKWLIRVGIACLLIVALVLVFFESFSYYKADQFGLSKVRAARPYSQLAHDAYLLSLNSTNEDDDTSQLDGMAPFSAVHYMFGLTINSVFSKHINGRHFPPGYLLSGEVVDELRLSQGLDFSNNSLDTIFASSWVSKNYTNNEALDYVLDSVFMGGSNFGLNQAAKHFFSKSFHRLNKSEVISLIVVSIAPSRYRQCDDQKILRLKAEGLVVRLKAVKPGLYANFRYELPSFSYC